ncbi:MAG: hypothetical protein AB1349_07950 [Elusimicrobiota bacterium]
MRTINRSAAIIKPKKPFWDWVKSVEPDHIINDEYLEDTSVYLLPDVQHSMDEDVEFEDYIKRIYKQIFEEELNAWYTDESLWPADRTFEMFQEWFGFEFHTVLLDTVRGAIRKEPL